MQLNWLINATPLRIYNLFVYIIDFPGPVRANRVGQHDRTIGRKEEKIYNKTVNTLGMHRANATRMKTARGLCSGGQSSRKPTMR